jgi:hypothetical protein
MTQIKEAKVPLNYLCHGTSVKNTEKSEETSEWIRIDQYPEINQMQEAQVPLNCLCEYN